MLEHLEGDGLAPVEGVPSWGDLLRPPQANPCSPATLLEAALLKPPSKPDCYHLVHKWASKGTWRRCGAASPAQGPLGGCCSSSHSLPMNELLCNCNKFLAKQNLDFLMYFTSICLTVSSIFLSSTFYLLWLVELNKGQWCQWPVSAEWNVTEMPAARWHSQLS